MEERRLWYEKELSQDLGLSCSDGRCSSGFCCFDLWLLALDLPSERMSQSTHTGRLNRHMKEKGALKPLSLCYLNGLCKYVVLITGYMKNIFILSKDLLCYGQSHAPVFTFCRIAVKIDAIYVRRLGTAV